MWMDYFICQWVMPRVNCSCLSASEYSHNTWMSHVKSKWVMSRVNEACHVWIWHVTCGWIISYVNESCLDWIFHVCLPQNIVIPCGWVMARVNGSCHVWKRHVTCEYGMSHVDGLFHMWMSHVTREFFMFVCLRIKSYHVDESCHDGMGHVTCERGVSRMNTACHMWMGYFICKWVMSRVNFSCLSASEYSHTMWMSQVTSEWVMSHVNKAYQRAAKDISLKMETYVCTTKAKIPPRKAIFPVLANLSFHRSLFEKEIYIYIPSADSLKSLHNFLKRTFVSVLGGPSGAVRVWIWRLDISPPKLYKKCCWVKCYCTMSIISIKFYLPPTDHPTPKS